MLALQAFSDVKYTITEELARVLLSKVDTKRSVLSMCGY